MQQINTKLAKLLTRRGKQQVARCKLRAALRIEFGVVASRSIYVLHSHNDTINILFPHSQTHTHSRKLSSLLRHFRAGRCGQQMGQIIF